MIELTNLEISQVDTILLGLIGKQILILNLEEVYPEDLVTGNEIVLDKPTNTVIRNTILYNLVNSRMYLLKCNEVKL
jgi:hypothetical protein